MKPRVHIIHKLVLCLLAGLLLAQSLLLLSSRQYFPGLPAVLVNSLCLLIMISSCVSIPFWLLREKKQRAENVPAFFQAVIIYCLAFVFSSFGFFKLLGLHMNTSLVFDDLPAGSMSGYHLMDYFFGKAPAFKLLLGALQLAGACCLLFSRLRLLGVFILMPVIFNVAVMDLQYQVGASITVLAFTLLAALVYLLWAEREHLIWLFFRAQSLLPRLPFKSELLRNMLRGSAVIVPALLLIPSRHPAKNTELNGKYEVLSYYKNNQPVSLDLNNDTTLTTVYFDENDDCVFRYNNYKHLKVGKTRYAAASQHVEVVWRYPRTARDPLNATLRRANDTLLLEGTMGAEKTVLKLVKRPLPSAD